MIKCGRCGKEATVHLCHPQAGKEPVEVHLCAECAAEQQLIVGKELQLSAIVQYLIAQHVGGLTETLSHLACPACGIKYMEFRQNGRLGCPHDYDSFRVGLESLLERIHRKTIHTGKRPRRKSPGSPTEMLELRRRLREAVDREEYEQAAKLRDLIRQKERTE